jgi:hypothetical protein
MKHVGKMKNNSARVVVAYRTLPGDAHSALVVGTQGLSDAYHDSLMTLVESEGAQQANELADILSARRFPDGTVMLGYLHQNGHLKKVPTVNVLMTPNTQTSIPLSDLNKIIAEQKGISIEDLAVTEEMPKSTKKPSSDKEEIIVETAEPVKSSIELIDDTPVTARDLRSMADKLYKEAQALRKKADELEPIVKKPKTEKAQ